MKKILTLFTMLLVTVSTLLAQAPSLSYQMIVRNQKTTQVGAFAPNDLVYSQSMNVYVAVVEATGNVAKVWAFTENGTGNGMIAPQATTNMNGMLSLTLSDYQPVELPAGYQIPTTVDATVKLKWFNEIEWQDAKVVLAIPEYGIMDTMEILPVPFAYKTFMKENITTPRIVKYIENATPEVDVAAVDEAITGNVPFMNALRDSVANAIKRNPGRTKELALYFIGLITPEDVENAADTVSQDVVEFVKDTVVKYIKNHRTEAYNLVKYYIGQTTKEDVSGFWNAAMNNEEVYEIAKMIVDSVNKYIKYHPELAVKTAKYIATHLTTEDVFTLQNFTKTNNPAAYDTAKSILNSLIDEFMAANDYQKNECHINLCELSDEINQYAQYRTVECPSFDATTPDNTNAPTKVRTNINKPDGFELKSDVYWYVLSFPNSVYPDTQVVATAHLNENTPYIEYEIPANLKGRMIVFKPMMKQNCKDLVTYGGTYTYNCTNCECPAIASFSYTSTAVGDLANYQGVKLTAKLTNSYNVSGIQYGFQVSTDDGAHWVNLNNKVNPALGTVGTDEFTFVDTIKMNYCDKQIKVRAYVTCNNQTTYSQEGSIKLRDLRLVISNDPANALTATNGIHISTQSYINEFDTDWPSVEQIVAKFGNEFGVSVVPEYKWYVNGVEQQNVQGNVYTPYVAGNEYKVTCSFSIFNSEPCVLEATYSQQ